MLEYGFSSQITNKVFSLTVWSFLLLIASLVNGSPMKNLRSKFLFFNITYTLVISSSVLLNILYQGDILTPDNEPYWLKTWLNFNNTMFMLSLVSFIFVYFHNQTVKK